MAKHTIYFAHGGVQRKQAPPLELKLVEAHTVDTEEVEEAGRAYADWLIKNASGNWTRGMREAFMDHKTMREEADERTE